MALKFEKYAQDGQHFVNKLASQLGHPEEKGRTGIVLRAVLHALRDRLTVGESLHLLASMPMALKGVYVDGWKYRDKPLAIKSMDDLVAEVEAHQREYGERDFSWDKSTEDIIHIVLMSLREFVPDQEYEHMISQFPKELKEIFSERIRH
jgi:uncharacterized protein (DUF2267 family)